MGHRVVHVADEGAEGAAVELRAGGAVLAAALVVLLGLLGWLFRADDDPPVVRSRILRIADYVTDHRGEAIRIGL